MTVDRVAGVALGALALFVLVESRKLPLGTLHNPGPAYMPVVLALTMLGFAAALVAFGGRAPHVATVGWRDWRHTAAILGAGAFAALALERLGFRLTVALLLLVLVGVVERRHPLTAVAYAVAMALGTFFLFNTILRVPLPRGPFGL